TSTAARGGPESARSRGEVERQGEAGYVRAAGGIHGNGVPLIGAAAAEVGGVDKRRARGVELRHESVREVKGGLEGARGGGEVRREGPTRHVRAAGGIHGNAVGRVTAAAAEVGGVDQGGAGRIKLRHEGVAASGGRLEGTRCRGKVYRASPTRHVGVAGGIHGDAEAPVIVA